MGEFCAAFVGGCALEHPAKIPAVSSSVETATGLVLKFYLGEIQG